MLLDKAQLLKKLTLKTEDVEIGGGKVRVTELGAEDYFKVLSDPANQDGDKMSPRFMPTMLALCVIDAKGNRLFTDADIEMLGKSALVPFKKLTEVVRRLNGLTGEEIKN